MSIKLKMMFFMLGLCFAPSLLSAQSYGDCATAKEICKKQSYTFDNVMGEGEDDTESDLVPCFLNGDNLGQAEQNSTWIKFEIAKSGSLTFTITPDNFEHDYDFVVYKLPGNGNCTLKQIVRCMAAGYAHGNSICMGETGLRDGEKDASEDAGCNDQGDNTWLAPLRVVEREQYALLISNVTESGYGFTINFGGSAKLPCDDEKKNEPEKPITPPAVVATPPTTTGEEAPSAQTIPTPTIETKPIADRILEVKEEYVITSRKLRVSLWDSREEDGDVASLYLNDKIVAEKVVLTKKPKEFLIDLPPGDTHTLTLYADDFGRKEPNTAAMRIIENGREKTFELVSSRKRQDGIKLIIK